MTFLKGNVRPLKNIPEIKKGMEFQNVDGSWTIFCLSLKNEHREAEQMVIMSDKSREFLKIFLPDVVNAEEPNAILGPLDEWILDWGFTPDWEELNFLGKVAEDVYDDIFFSNYD